MRDFSKSEHKPPAGLDGADIRHPTEQRFRAIDACTRLLSECQTAKIVKPPELQGDPRLRATWWVDYMLEPIDYPSERPMRTTHGKNEEAAGLVEPYVNRTVDNLAEFLRQEHAFQRYILAAREDRVFWRGDQLAMFSRIVETTLLWRELDGEGKAKLKADSIRRGKAVVRKMVQRPAAPGPSRAVDISAERSRQIEALYRFMSPDQRANYDHRNVE